jgi:DNA-3-methyladenine glycosylase I
MNRCAWVNQDPLYIRYHDEEWGQPLHDDTRLFEMLTLEGAQAGLSWYTVLQKRENFRMAFDNFNVTLVASYDEDQYEALLQNSGIIRNRLKIRSTINNAKAFMRVQEQFGSFDAYLWGYIDGMPIVNQWKHIKEVPASTPLSDQLSKDLKRRGFNFVGSTICYAFMQAVGMINDHTVDCFKHISTETSDSRSSLLGIVPANANG